MGLANNNFIDTVNREAVSGAVTVGTTEVEAKVGASPLSKRQILTIKNNSNKTIYYGPTGVTTSTGSPLEETEFIAIPLGPDVSIFLISADTGLNVRIQEYA